jgi:hypothetical protein
MQRASTYEEVLSGVLAHYLKQLERESILKKIDLIFRACTQAGASWSRGKGFVYVFDRGRLERLDRLRHELIHGDALGMPIRNALEDLHYMLNTAIYLTLMIGDRYSLTIRRERVRAWSVERMSRGAS